MSQIPDFQAIADEAVASIAAAADLDALEQARVRFVGRKAPLTEELGSIGSLAPEDRGRVGKDGNALGALQSVSICAGLPYTLAICFLCVSL